MSKIRYKAIRFTEPNAQIIAVAEQIATDYAQQGFDLTLRQLYYQFVARGFIPNTEQSYKRLGSIINDARLAGLIDWNHITDRTRNVRANPHWATPQDIVKSAASQFRYDIWANQGEYIEVWIEKDALVGVIAGVCTALDVPHFSCRGYTSQSEMWTAAQRIIERCDALQKDCTIIHLGDHDPSGIDMTRDIKDRLRMFTAYERMKNDWRFSIERIALNMDQVRRYNPPPNPAKITDSRIRGYVVTYGRESWELDALDPATLAALVQKAIEKHMNVTLFKADVLKQEQARNQINGVAEQWTEVSALVGTLKAGVPMKTGKKKTKKKPIR